MWEGTLHKISQFLTRDKLRVLFYHRVNTSGDIFAMDPTSFERQIRYLSTHFTIITLEEYIDLIESSRSIKNAILITFDDGYRDNYTFAYPILRKYSVPAIFFLTTDFIDGRRWLWFDMVRYALDMTPLKKISLKLDGTEYGWDIGTNADKSRTRKAIFLLLRNVPPDARLAVIGNLGERCNIQLPDVPTGGYAPLSWDQVREMSRSGMDFGAHSCTHEILSTLKKEDAYLEISKCKKRIEEELHKPVWAFAYPNGQREDFTDETASLVQQCGYKCAFTTMPGMVDSRRCKDPFTVGRLSAGIKFNKIFLSEVSGLSSMWNAAIRIYKTTLGIT